MPRRPSVILSAVLGVLLVRPAAAAAALDPDPSGYVAYCPCMGRFGNQADHLLGAVGFAKALNRTLLLPHWIEYRTGRPKSVQVPFDEYFDVARLSEYHRVLPMDRFMAELAAGLWPPERRAAFCYVRRGVGESPPNDNGCNAKSGNPFESFWDTYGVDFASSEFYAPLHYDVHRSNDVASGWRERYPPSGWPVLAFVGAPASFPVQKENVAVHGHLEWSERVRRSADAFVGDRLRPGKFVGVHLRNGVDWARACEHVADNPLLFSAPQCLGYRNEYGRATRELCYPSFDTVVKQLKRRMRDDGGDVGAIFVASDSDHRVPELSRALASFHVRVVKYDRDDPHVDLAILGRADYFIGNCVSSFSAFVKRERDSHGRPSEFWAFPVHQKTNNNRLLPAKDEL